MYVNSAVIFRYQKDKQKTDKISNRFGPVYVDKKRKIVSFREKKWKFEFTRADVVAWLGKSVYRLGVVGVLIVSAVVVTFTFPSNAKTAYFYAGTCLGEWENPGNAEGMPQVVDGSDNWFNSVNSAISRAKEREIFCGDFQGEVPHEVSVGRATLSFSLYVGNEVTDEDGVIHADGKELEIEDFVIVASDDDTGLLDVDADVDGVAGDPEELEELSYDDDSMSATDPLSGPETETISEDITTDDTTDIDTTGSEGSDTTVSIEGSDFVESIYDIIDAPEGSEVTFTLIDDTTEDEDMSDDTTVIVGDDFTESVLDIIDAPEGEDVQFQLVEDSEQEEETLPEADDGAADSDEVDEDVTESDDAADAEEESDVMDDITTDGEEASLMEGFWLNLLSSHTAVVYATSTDESIDATSDTETMSTETVEDGVTGSEGSDTTVSIEGSDFVESIYDIIDAPEGSEVTFTLIDDTTEDEDMSDDTTVIVGDDFTESVLDIIDAPEGEDVQFQLVEDSEQEEETLPEADDGAADSDEVDEDVTESDDATDTGGEDDVIDDVKVDVVDTGTIEVDTIRDATGDILPDIKVQSFFSVEYTFDSVEWVHVGYVTEQGWQDISFTLPVVSWDDISNVQVRLRSEGVIEKTIFLDAVMLSVKYFDGKKPASIERLSDKKSFRAGDDLDFSFKYRPIETEKGVFGKILDALTSVLKTKKKDIVVVKTRLVDVLGIEYEVEPTVIYGDDDTWTIIVHPEKRILRPGKYIIMVEIDDGEGISVEQQEFYWGVLAINTNKSIFEPNEEAYLQMGVLDNAGHTICDAQLELLIRDPNDDETILTTEDRTIEYSGVCNGDTVVDIPDYFAHYTVSEVGVYNMRLTNLDNNYEMLDSFEVRDSVPFVVERVGPTRIYPPATYEMQISITAKQDFDGDIYEYIPDTFEVTDVQQIFSEKAKTPLASDKKELYLEALAYSKESTEIATTGDISTDLAEIETLRQQQISTWLVWRG